MAFVGLFFVLLGLGYQVWIWEICTSCLEYYPTNICNSISDPCQQFLARRVNWISVPMVIIQGLLCYGLIKRRCGFLTPWLLVSFIGIIGGAYNFGYVSNWFYFFIIIFLVGANNISSYEFLIKIRHDWIFLIQNINDIIISHISEYGLLYLGVCGLWFLYQFWYCIWTVLVSFYGGGCSRGYEWIKQQSRRKAWKCGANIWEGHSPHCILGSDGPEEEWYHSIGWICWCLIFFLYLRKTNSPKNIVVFLQSQKYWSK